MLTRVDDPTRTMQGDASTPDDNSGGPDGGEPTNPPDESITDGDELTGAGNPPSPERSEDDGDNDNTEIDDGTPHDDGRGQAVEVTVAPADERGTRVSSDNREPPPHHETTGTPTGRQTGPRTQPRTDRPPSPPRSEAELEREILDPEERIGPDQDHCRHCGAVFSATAEACPDCGNPHPRSIDPPASTRKVPTVAALLSVLLPGAGHLYNEQFGRGLLAFLGTITLVGTIAFVGLVLDVLVTVASFGTLSLLGTVILLLAVCFGWVLPVSVAAWDAYDQARQLNAG